MEIVGLAVAGYVLHKNDKKRQELHRVHDSVTQQLQVESPKRVNVHMQYFREASLQQVLAMLVDGVYCRDQKGVDFNLVIKPFVEQQYKVDERAEHYRALHWTHMKQWTAYEDEDAKMVGLAHYFRKDNHPNPLAPRLVIALRGTKLSSSQDIIDDFKILTESLECSKRFKTCQSLVESLIKKFQDHHDGTPAEICITGHSLGAAIALLIAKNLASKNQRYAVHCFNPPLIIHSLFRGVHSYSELEAAVGNFQHLVDWMPVLYINEHDPICRHYLKYYRNKSTWSLNGTSSKTMQISRVLGKRAKYSALVPSVIMYVSCREKGSHKLKQWYTDPELRVPKKEEYQLLGRQPPVSSWSKRLSFDVNGRIHDGGNYVEESMTNMTMQMGSVTLYQTEVAANYVAAPTMDDLAMATGGRYPQNLQFLQQGTNQQSIHFQQYQLQCINVQQHQQPSINVQEYHEQQGITNQERSQQYYSQQYPPQSDQQYGQQCYPQAAVQIGEMKNSSGAEVGKHADPFMIMGVKQSGQQYPPQQCGRQYPPLQCDQQYPSQQCDQQYPPLQCGQQGEHFQQAATMNGSHV